MARIHTVKIRRFKRLASIELPLADVTLLIGANNAGKSSVLQAIHFAVAIAQTARLIGEGVAWRNDTFELSFNPSQLLYSPVADVLSLATGGELQETRTSQVEIELLSDDGKSCIVGLRRGRNRNIGVSIHGRDIGERLMDLEHPFTVFAPGLAGIPKEERFLSAGVVRRIVARGDANLALRNVLRMLKRDEPRWNQYVQDMQTIFGAIEIDIEFNEETDELIAVRFKSPDGPWLQLDAAGTSVLQASQLLAYIALFRPQLLILDEPDSHLHPDNQRTLCDLIVRLAAERGFQALISTHSRHVLDSLGNRGKVVWLSKGRMADEADFNVTKVLLDIGALDSVDYFADGETRCVVATEDTDTEALSALLWSSGFLEDATSVVSYSGCSKLEAALVLGGFLKDKAPHVELVIHRDRDYMSDDLAAKLAQKLSAAGIHLFLTEPSDVEGYFINAAHLNGLNPSVTVERIEALIGTAISDAADASIEAMVNCRTEEAFRQRSSGGGAPNHGAIALAATADYQGNPRLHSRGKKVLGRIRALLQQETGAHPLIFRPSIHLALDSLRATAANIWP